jgi:hypothetical protein
VADSSLWARLSVIAGACTSVVALLLASYDTNAAGSDNSIAVPEAGGVDTSLALDSFDRPVISYSDGQLLKVLHCGNLFCSSGNTINTPDTLGSFQRRTSLQLDALGNPVVAYVATDGLRLVHCNDAGCSGGDENVELVDPSVSGISGSISIELDGVGHPVVSYISGGLTVLHCNDPNCTGGDESTVSAIASAAAENSLELDSAESRGEFYDCLRWRTPSASLRRCELFRRQFDLNR